MLLNSKRDALFLTKRDKSMLANHIKYSLAISLLLISILTHAESILFKKINYSPDNNTQISVSIEQNKVIALNMQTHNQMMLQNLDSIPDYARDLWLEDFNFDGMQDIAITTSSDTDGMNQAYTIFTWNPAVQNFTSLPFSATLSNIERIKKKKELRSSYKSGGFWREDSYRFNRQHIPYLYSRAELLAIDAWYTEIYSATQPQKMINHFISTSGRGNYPNQYVFGHIIAENTPLYTAPLPSTLNNIFLNRGTKVKLIDFKKNQQGLNWLYIRTYSRNPIEGWTPLMNISLE
jgi:hypothetical protein